ncbi:porin family protein [Saccharicrinis aurantiacus]|uniref:type IX secretion/gliding motility protein PorT/SprT n=1 Tax=Saccharicrinis aurantiacus TaxID=1849719 RepID=UPI002493C811|nr:porin family protein [Saccharicrinis aurantiacus]
MKHLIIVFFLVSLGLGTYAQSSKKKVVPNLVTFDQKRLHFGFLIGVNTMDFTIHHSGASTPENGNNPLYASVESLTPGINLGIVSSLRLNQNFNLRVLPGISFGQRNLSYIDENKVEKEDDLQIKSTFIEMPILIKYSSSRIKNYKPYLVAGINPRYDLAKSKQDGLALNKMDLYYEIGFGIDSYLNYFKLTTEFKISIGMFDVLNHEGTGDMVDLPYTQAIDKLTSNIFQLTFYFE